MQGTIAVFMCLAQVATVESYLQHVLILANIATHNILIPAIYFIAVVLLFWYTQEAQALPIEDESLAFGKLRRNVSEEHIELDDEDDYEHDNEDSTTKVVQNTESQQPASNNEQEQHTKPEIIITIQPQQDNEIPA